MLFPRLKAIAVALSIRNLVAAVSRASSSALDRSWKAHLEPSMPTADLAYQALTGLNRPFPL